MGTALRTDSACRYCRELRGLCTCVAASRGGDRAACDVATLPAVTRNALVLMNCMAVSLSPVAAANLDGGTAVEADAPTSAYSELATQVLTSNPLYICWVPGGSHRPAGVLAALVFAVVVVGLPVTSLVAVCSEFVRELGSRWLFSTASLLSAPLLDYYPFLADYRAGAWYTRHADLSLTFLLAALQALLPRPQTTGSIVAKALCSCAASLALALHTAIIRPFAPDQTWKTPCVQCCSVSRQPVRLSMLGHRLLTLIYPSHMLARSLLVQVS